MIGFHVILVCLIIIFRQCTMFILIIINWSWLVNHINGKLIYEYNSLLTLHLSCLHSLFPKSFCNLLFKIILQIPLKLSQTVFKSHMLKHFHDPITFFKNSLWYKSTQLGHLPRSKMRSILMLYKPVASFNWALSLFWSQIVLKPGCLKYLNMHQGSLSYNRTDRSKQ